MNVIIINPVDKTITEAESTNDFSDYYQKIGNHCDLIQEATKLNRSDKIWVDEEGLLKEGQSFFYVKDAHQPFAGNGVVEGSKKNGVKLTLEELKDLVFWVMVASDGQKFLMSATKYEERMKR